MLTKAQLEMRKTGLGGSDVSAALGLSPWKTQLQLWAEKCGKLDSPEQSSAMEWGSRLEGAIYGKFSQEHTEYQCSYGNGSIRHDTYKFLLATPDGFLHDQDGRQGILEIKTSGQSVWDDVPLYYILQAQHYCYVLNKEFFMFAVLFRGTDYMEYGPFEFDRELYEERILPRLSDFWDCVETANPVFKPTNLNDLSLIVDVDKERSIVANIDQRVLIEDYRKISNRIGQYQEEADRLKLAIAESMGDAHKLVSEDGKTLAVQIQTADSTIVDGKKLKAEEPELFEKYSKVKKGYRSLRVY